MSYPKIRIISRPLQILMTIMILLFVVAAADGIILAITEALSYRQNIPTKKTTQIIYEGLTPEEEKQLRLDRSTVQFQEDGTIHLLDNLGRSQSQQDYLISHPQISPVTKSAIYDINDKMIWEGNTPDIPYQYLGWLDQPSSNDNMIYMSNSDVDSRRLRGSQALVPELTQTLEINLEIGDGRLEFWRYDPAGDFLIGYEARGPKIGYISAEGFTASESQTRPFGRFGSLKNFTKYNPFRPAVLWQTDKRLYQIDLQTRQVEVLFESPQVDIMTSSLKRCTHQTSPEIVSYLKLFDENCRPFIDCKLQDKSHHLILMNPVQYLTISIPAEWANWYERKIEITATKQGVFLHRAWAQRKPRPIHIRTKQYEAWAKEYFGKPISMSDELYKVNEDGSLQLINSFSRTKPASKQTISLEKSPTITRSAQTFLRAFSSPLYAVAFNTFEVEILDELSKPSNLLSALSAVLIQELHPNKMLPNLLLSGIFALAALWHGWARRTSWGKLILWLIIIGVFNLAGLLTYLALNHTPVIKCPACGRKRGLEMDNCSRCGSPLPIPQRKPTDLIMAN